LRIWIGSFGSFPPFPIKHQKDDDDDDDDYDDDDDSLEVWSNVRVGGNMFYHFLAICHTSPKLVIVAFLDDSGY